MTRRLVGLAKRLFRSETNRKSKGDRPLPIQEDTNLSPGFSSEERAACSPRERVAKAHFAKNPRKYCWGSSLRLSLSPFVPGIAALELLLEPRVVVAPEAREVLGDLDRPHTGGQDMEQYRDSPHGDARRGGHII